MTKDEVKKLRMNSPESLQFLNNATKFYNLMMMYRCAIREIQTKLEVLDDEFSVENNRNPISFIKTRIKQPNSIYDKLQRPHCRMHWISRQEKRPRTLSVYNGNPLENSYLIREQETTHFRRVVSFKL